MFSCPPARETLERTVEAIRSCGDAAVTIEAFRYRNGEICEDEAWPVAAVLDAILAAGGTVEDLRRGPRPHNGAEHAMAVGGLAVLGPTDFGDRAPDRGQGRSPDCVT